MKKTIVLCLLFSVRLAFSQEITLDLPVLSPQTPNAFSFTKYGEVQVNESTGVISPSIPLFTYNAGNISIPITLQYSGNGVKVSQEPTWSGMNWNMNPAGVITRQVRDRVDEKTSLSYKYFKSSSDLSMLSGVDVPFGTMWSEELLGVASNPLIDSEVDIFNYNFPGYSGSFFLDKNSEAHLINFDKEVKINFIYDNGNNQSSIAITTPNGDIYSFGGVNSDASRAHMGTIASNALSESAQNAFYLYRISPVMGGNVNFEYSNMVDGIYNYTSTTAKQESYTVSVTTVNSCGGGSNMPSGSKGTPRDIITNYTSAVYLSRISSTLNSQVVEFNSSRIGNPTNSSHHRRKLNSIVIKDGSNGIVNQFYLTYTNVATELDAFEDRFFLTSVDLYGNNINDTPQEYLLSYENLSIFPKKDSYSQDHFGYFNGKSNTTLLPRLDAYEVIKSDYSLADRDSDPLKATIGTLTKIQYPTGGLTEFEYELGQIGVTPKIIPTNMHIYKEYYYPGDTRLEYTFWPDGGDGALITTTSTNVNFHVSASVSGAITHSFIELTAENLNNSTILKKSIPLENTNPTTKNYSEDYTFNLSSGGAYIFRFKLNLHATAINDPTVIINANATSNLPLPQVLVPVYGSGIRIKRVKSKQSDVDIPLITRYYYNEKQNYNEQSFDNTVRQTQYVFETMNRSYCGLLYNQTNLLNLTASSLTNAFGDDSGKVLYDFVTISYGGDLFENGGKELKFKVAKDMSIYPYWGNQIYSNYGTNLSYANSRLEKETIFNYNNGSFKTSKEISYTYQTDWDKSYTHHNVKVSEYSNAISPSNTIERYNIGLYETLSKWDYLESVEVREFLNNSLTPVITVTNYEYTTKLAGLPNKISTTKSDGTTSIQELTYPNEAYAITDISTNDQNMINDLFLDHRYSELVRIKSYKDTTLLTTTQTLYDYFGSLTLPKTIKFAKAGGTLEDRITFLNYNPFGKPTLLSKKDGSLISYGYNLLQQVIYKREQVGNGIIDDSINPTSKCFYQDSYPNDLVTSFKYAPLTNALSSITDPRCDVITYHYDNFNRMEYVKDAQGNILSKNEYHYKNQQ